MSRYLSFFESAIELAFKEDTNTKIGTTLIALAYPDVILIGPPPHFSDAVVDVKKDGVAIALDDYPLLQFLREHPEFCEKIVHSHEDLLECFKSYVE